jgi:hypothetical protein
MRSFGTERHGKAAAASEVALRTIFAFEPAYRIREPVTRRVSMRAILPSALLALVVAAPLSASENEPAPPEPLPAVIEEPTAERPPVPAMNLQEIQVEERSAAPDAEVAQVPRRGSFWWLVGVIVVAGVILAVLL